MKGGKYIKIPVRIQVSLVSNRRDIQRNVLPKFIEFCLETPIVGVHPNGHQHGNQKPTETFVTEFCYESVKSSLEQLIVVKIVLFLIPYLFR